MKILKEKSRDMSGKIIWKEYEKTWQNFKNPEKGENIEKSSRDVHNEVTKNFMEIILITHGKDIQKRERKLKVWGIGRNFEDYLRKSWKKCNEILKEI